MRFRGFRFKRDIPGLDYLSQVGRNRNLVVALVCLGNEIVVVDFYSARLTAAVSKIDFNLSIYGAGSIKRVELSFTNAVIACPGPPICPVP